MAVRVGVMESKVEGSKDPAFGPVDILITPEKLMLQLILRENVGKQNLALKCLALVVCFFFFTINALILFPRCMVYN